MQQPYHAELPAHRRALGTVILTVQAKRNLTNEELAEKSGVSVSTIRALQNGTASVQYDNVIAVLLALGLDLIVEEKGGQAE